MSEVGLLAEGVAHEINNPLNNILASIDMIKICAGNSELIKNKDIANVMKEGGCDIKKYFELMKDEIERCKDITKKLLTLSRPVCNFTDIFNVNNSIEETLALISFTAGKKNIMIKKNLAGDIPLISFSEAGLRQVLLNIALNAVQAVREETGIVYFITKKIKDYIYIIIVDNGCGIAQEDIKKIFDPFFSKRKNSASTGLGLSISMSIVKSLGGSIEVRSKLDYGISFSGFFVRIRRRIYLYGNFLAVPSVMSVYNFYGLAFFNNFFDGAGFKQRIARFIPKMTHLITVSANYFGRRHA